MAKLKTGGKLKLKILCGNHKMRQRPQTANFFGNFPNCSSGQKLLNRLVIDM